MDKYIQPIKSRPRAIVLQLHATQRANNAMLGFLEDIAEAALSTGLPIVVIASVISRIPAALREVGPPHVTVAQKIPHLGDILAAAMSDVLWISDGTEARTIPACASIIQLEEALPRLQGLCRRYRRAPLCGNIPIEPEMAHTVLVPLDLELGSMRDPHRLLTHGRCVFDTVLLVESLVPTAGFKVKFLEKLVADFAPIIVILDNELNDGREELRNSLMRFSSGGAKTVIAVSRRMDELPGYQFLEDQVRDAGLAWHRTIWDDLGGTFSS